MFLILVAVVVVVDARGKRSVALVHVNRNRVVVAVEADDFRLAVASQVAGRGVACVVVPIGSRQAYRSIGIKPGSRRQRNLQLAAFRLAGKVNFPVAVEVGEDHVARRVSGQLPKNRPASETPLPSPSNSITFAGTLLSKARMSNLPSPSMSVSN